MRKHEGFTRVRKHSRMERFLPPDHATEQAIVQIGHRRFLQLANCFSKLFSKLACCLASGSGTGVGQLLRFVAGQIQDRAEVSHLRGGVRLAGASSFCKLLFRSARSFERRPARNRVVFINSGKGCGKRGPLPESRGTAELALCLQVVRCRQVRGAGNSLQGSSVDENLPISGRSPQFFCHGSSREGAACADECAQASRATRTPGRSCRSDPMPCSSANPSSPCSALSP